ncbi:ankyrin repeat domain-containing protein 46-like [Babylonia areolata]|uniref:ankyrin repeat domain-containing protein 46-like n=1 Tax=Babylonia areolata TaxID=304850 RepID=UPI003FD0C109
MDCSDIMECSCKLHDAVLEGNFEMIKNILETSSCNVNETDEKHWNGRTALHLAAMKGKSDIVALLLEKGADVSSCDNRGNTPLHWCGHPETIELLVEYGANVLQCNNRGLTPRDMAERRGVSGSTHDLLCQLELEVKESGARGHTLGAAADSDISSRHSVTMSNKRKKASSKQSLSGLWQECASELGSRNFLLLLLGVLGFSLYIAFILTGMHHGSGSRIPIEVH